MGQAAYSASKAGVVGITLPIARDLSNEGIRVNAILPGIFGMTMMSGMDQKVQDALGNSVPFPKRLGDLREYAALAIEMCRNGYFNGEDVRLDGAIRMPPVKSPYSRIGFGSLRLRQDPIRQMVTPSDNASNHQSDERYNGHPRDPQIVRADQRRGLFSMIDKAAAVAVMTMRRRLRLPMPLGQLKGADPIARRAQRASVRMGSGRAELVSPMF